MIENCPMRHENGNCIPAGGFCTANKNICEALLNAYRMGKAQLSQEGTTFDLISRTETVKQLQGVLDVTVPITDYDGGFIDGVEVGVSTVSTMPPIQPEPRTGKWTLGFDNRYMEKYYYCSRCGGRKYGEYEPLDYFCSNCGADMRGEKDG